MKHSNEITARSSQTAGSILTQLTVVLSALYICHNAFVTIFLRVFPLAVSLSVNATVRIVKCLTKCEFLRDCGSV